MVSAQSEQSDRGAEISDAGLAIGPTNGTCPGNGAGDCTYLLGYGPFATGIYDYSETGAIGLDSDPVVQPGSPSTFMITVKVPSNYQGQTLQLVLNPGTGNQSVSNLGAGNENVPLFYTPGG